MNINLEKIDDTTSKIVVNVEESDYASKVTEELKKIGRTHTIPGFRKGHVPTEQLRRRFGRDVKSDVINREVIDKVFDYIKENNLHVLGEPLPVERKEITMEEKDYTFEYEIGMAPEINVVLDKEVHLPVYEIEVTKEMTDERDESLRRRFGSRETSETVDATAIVKGVIMELNEDGSVKEGEDAIQVINGMIGVFQIPSQEQKDLFIGKKLNDKVRFNPATLTGNNTVEIASMLNIDRDRVASVNSDFEIAISEILIVKPAEHAQEFFDEVFGRDKVHNEEEYQAALKAMIAQEFTQYTDYRFSQDAEKALIEKYGDMQLPREFLKKWLAARNPEVSAEDIDKDFDSVLESLKWQLIKERVAKEINLQITEEDLTGFANAIAARQLAQYGITNMDEQTISDMGKRLLNDAKTRERIVENIGDIKLFAGIRNAVTCDVNTISLEEFQKLMAPEAPAEA